MPADATFLDAQTTQWLWKTEAMQRMAIALVELAMSHDEFAADDLPPTLDHGGSGIAGSIMDKLASNGIITKAGKWDGSDFLVKTRTSKAANRNSARIPVWKLADRVKAASFLRAKHSHKELHQAEFLTS